MPFYSQENIEKLNNQYGEIEIIYRLKLLEWSQISSRLMQEEAKEYLLHGFLRRLKILKICIDNIFEIYPPEKIELLTDYENLNITINWQAFNINIFGSIDNLAWLLVKEREILIKKESEVKFNNPHILKMLSSSFKNYLNERKDWFSALKDFRDALAHRISPYMPSGYDNEAKAFHNLPVITHSYSEESKPFILHGQIIADWMTIIEFGDKFFEELNQILT